MTPLYSISLKVTDRQTGLATPCRLHIRDEQGRYYPPHGRTGDFPTKRAEMVGTALHQSDRNYAVIDGNCEIYLPSGVPLFVEISKGIFYQPISKVVTLGAGQLTLRFQLDPWELGNEFTQADSRCHFLTPHDARLEAAAEDIDFAHLLVVAYDQASIDGTLYRSFANLVAFSGQQETFGSATTGVFVNTLNTHPVLGRLSLLHSHRVIYPLVFGSFYESDDWSLGDWCCQCHRKNGLVVWTDAYRPESGMPGGEALIQAAYGGRVDAFEIDGLHRQTPILPAWYRLLNAGIHLTLVGGSGKDSNRLPLGCLRTLTARSDAESPTITTWTDQVRRGETQVTNGPVIRWTINGKAPSKTLIANKGETLTIRASAESLVPFEHLELISQGKVTASGRQELEHQINVSEPIWLAVRCRGSTISTVYPQMPVFAHTSATMIEIVGTPKQIDAPAARALIQQIEAVREWANTTARYEQARFKAELLAEIDTAIQRLSPS